MDSKNTKPVEPRPKVLNKEILLPGIKNNVKILKSNIKKIRLNMNNKINFYLSIYD